MSPPGVPPFSFYPEAELTRRKANESQRAACYVSTKGLFRLISEWCSAKSASCQSRELRVPGRSLRKGFVEGGPCCKQSSSDLSCRKGGGPPENLGVLRLSCRRACGLDVVPGTRGRQRLGLIRRQPPSVGRGSKEAESGKEVGGDVPGVLGGVSAPGTDGLFLQKVATLLTLPAKISVCGDLWPEERCPMLTLNRPRGSVAAGGRRGSAATSRCSRPGPEGWRSRSPAQLCGGSSPSVQGSGTHIWKPC